AADFDRDGDLDLFVGTRSIPGQYPATPVSQLLINDGTGVFTQAPLSKAPGLDKVGLVTSALWSDANNDGWLDLFITTEWGLIRYFTNAKGTLLDATQQVGLAGETKASYGWWNGIAGRDIDADGDIDYVVTNMGTNTHFQPSVEQPELIFYDDFDGSGKKHIIGGHFKTEKGNVICYPRASFTAAGGAMNMVFEKMQTFHEYASAPLPEIYGLSKLENAFTVRADNASSSVLINDGVGKFTLTPLPNLAQVSPSYGVALSDIDLDGYTDCYLVQNHYSMAQEIGILGSGLSILLKGTGETKAPFTEVWPKKSGLEVPEDAKSLSAVDLNSDGYTDFVVGLNDAAPEIFVNQIAETSSNRPLTLRLSLKGNPTAVGSRV
ncbi:MAG: VCBS repeat-containing protein, partial [Verrucomicrobiota bacterium]